MPIYAYRCEACGFTKDVLQKVSDAPLTECLACGKSAFKKQLTAAGFQLKGTGWYVTDFRNGGTGGSSGASKSDAKPADSAASGTQSPTAAGSTADATAPAKGAPAA